MNEARRSLNTIDLCRLLDSLAIEKIIMLSCRKHENERIKSITQYFKMSAFYSLISSCVGAALFCTLRISIREYKLLPKLVPKTLQPQSKGIQWVSSIIKLKTIIAFFGILTIESDT